MLHIRVIKTSSNAKAVQVTKYVNRKRIVVKHIGSAHTQIELDALLQTASDFMDSYTKQSSLFEFKEQSSSLLHIQHTQFLGVYLSFLYDVLNSIYNKIGLSSINDSLLLDLVTIRLIEPSSKLRAIELIETHFGIKHTRQHYYKTAPNWLTLKCNIETKTIAFATEEYGFNYDLLFYDVTTLYFESFEEDELRKNGFSKDNKSQQPQILIALMVTKEGFPVSYEVFAGNTFEGNTIIPVIQSFVTKNKVKHFTVVADAAMISTANIEALQQANIHYIVGARLGNLSAQIIATIDEQLLRKDGNTIRIKIDNGYLICSYAEHRYKKDKYEMDKQVEKAKLVIEKPSKNKKLKYTKSKNEKLELNEKLIEKSKILLGVKGYITDIDESISSNTTIIERYHELYKIEQAFRISKNDLQTRPIFHSKEEPIQLHILICFMALVTAKHIELKTKTSIKKFITECKKVTDARMMNKITNKEIRMRTKYSAQINQFLELLGLSH